jgi:hypothetical protein
MGSSAEGFPSAKEVEMVSPESWREFAKDVGVPGLITFFLMWALVKAGVWFGTNVIIPVRDRHMKFLDSLESTLIIIVESQKTVVRHVELNSRAIELNSAAIAALTKKADAQQE